MSTKKKISTQTKPRPKKKSALESLDSNFEIFDIDEKWGTGFISASKPASASSLKRKKNTPNDLEIEMLKPSLKTKIKNFFRNVKNLLRLRYGVKDDVVKKAIAAVEKTEPENIVIKDTKTGEKFKIRKNPSLWNKDFIEGNGKLSAKRGLKK